ncbi:MAG: hypothetical protein M0R05_07320 [Bacilli bacterium]|nr:hypothetical protein [Bacilli bacterium]MDD4077863.1 hypothetical protein [Bacilli bacterium]
MGNLLSVDNLYFLKRKGKKELIKFLNKNSIPFKTRKREVWFQANLFDALPAFTVAYTFNSNPILNLDLPFDNEKEGNKYQEILSKELTNLYGVPNNDNSNHNKDNVRINWKKDKDSGIALFKTNSSNNIQLHLYNKQIDHSFAFTIGISMIDGLVWGILFFIFMGLEFGYTWLNLAVSMIGGIFWGLLFGMIMGLTTKSKSKIKIKEPKITQKEIDIFKKYEKDNNLSDFSSAMCISLRSSDKKSKFPKYILTKTCIFFLDDRFICLYLKNKKITQQDYKYDDVKRYSIGYGYSISFHNQRGLLIYSGPADNIIERNLNRILNINEEQLLKTIELVNESFIEYDFNSLIRGGASKDIFKNDAKNIALTICTSKIEMTCKEIESIIRIYYEDYDYNDDYMYERIEEKLKQIKIELNGEHSCLEEEQASFK